ncbi:DUF262 domain-containing protein [Tepidanaerobacter acetatoxydans]|uniref:DUF262 domain-containing protein n=1 Tax=Tepidanaerobacter acetatoxydans TaxID=499229 RepID=UPI001BD6DAC6|nr:DUF262 domain-containing protein [Tepidanaerobacter acetatoxydans]
MSIGSYDMTINQVFSHTKYYIDFYQREYKWKRPHIINLLDDIFYRFELEYKPTIDPTPENINKYEWYYLSSFMTNSYNGQTYIVDGQQRLTTLTLIMINLYHMGNKFSEAALTEMLKTKIYGADIAGRTYWMGQNGRTEVLEKMLKNEPFDTLPDNNISYVNMVNNYQIIQRYLEEKLINNHIYKSFVIYFLTKIILIKIHIEQQKDVAMVFEVINDRGEKLRPYEVFKGSLLGLIDKDEIDSKYNEIWQEGIEPLESISDDLPDNFFRDYFRAKYVDSLGDYRDYDGEYHKTVFSNKWNEVLQLKRNVNNIKKFINDDFRYYSSLYHKLMDQHIYDKPYGEYVFYNSLTDQDRQMLLILAACKVNDPEEDEKIKIVSKLLDRHYVLLHLFGCYDSNSFTNTIIDINKSIRNKDIKDIQSAFDAKLLEDINAVKNTSITQPFEYAFFKDTSNNLGIRFVRYFFARIENYLSININNESLTATQYYNYVRNTGSVNGYHVEHILSNNSENKALLNNDEETFQKERNRLGALLLLKGKDNISSSNEVYKNKLKTYSASNLWNRTLISDFYHTNKDFNKMIVNEGLKFKPYDVFDGKAVEERQQLLFQLVKKIWG